jgi:hypothetical protein
MDLGIYCRSGTVMELRMGFTYEIWNLDEDGDAIEEGVALRITSEGSDPLPLLRK